jgi:hypothetical protein
MKALRPLDFLCMDSTKQIIRLPARIRAILHYGADAARRKIFASTWNGRPAVHKAPITAPLVPTASISMGLAPVWRISIFIDSEMFGDGGCSHQSSGSRFPE